MKAQIAIIAGGLAIAAGVAYAELKPATTTSPQINQSSASPQPSQSQAQTTDSQQTPTQIKEAPAQTQQRLTNPNTRPKLPNGGGEAEGREGGNFDGEDD